MGLKIDDSNIPVYTYIHIYLYIYIGIKKCGNFVIILKTQIQAPNPLIHDPNSSTVRAAEKIPWPGVHVQLAHHERRLQQSRQEPNPEDLSHGQSIPNRPEGPGIS